MDKKLIYAVLIIIVIAIAGILFWRGISVPVAQPPIIQEPQTSVIIPVEKKNDTTETINASLKGIDIGDIDTEFKDIDGAINTL